MRKFLVVFLALILGATALMAQIDPAVGNDTGGNYAVVEGDNLSFLAKTYLHDGTRWAELVKLNPWLAERVIEYPPSAKYPEGMTDVRIYWGRDVLKGLTTTEVADIKSDTPVLPALDPPPAKVEAVTEMPAESSYFSEPTNQFAWPWLLMLLLGLALLIGTILVFTRHRKFTRPAEAQSGPPIVTGGIPPTEPLAVQDRFNTIARDYQRNDLGITSGPMPTIVSPISQGFLNGPGRVGYDREQVANMQARFFRNEPAYRATFRFANPDGTTRDEVLYFLQNCANDVRYLRRRYLGFRFTAEREVTMPEPQPEQPEQPAAQGPRIVQIGNPIADGTTSILVGETEFSFTAGARIRVLPNGTAEIALANGTVLTATPQKPRKARKAAPPLQAAGGNTV